MSETPEGAPVHRTPEEKHLDMLRGWVDGVASEAEALGLNFDQALSLRTLVAADGLGHSISALLVLADRLSGPCDAVLGHQLQKLRDEGHQMGDLLSPVDAEGDPW